jgi:tetratricopeptide (TPR) repeat protein
VNTTVRILFDQAVHLHQRGELLQAEALYRRIVAQAPNHADALHLLGVVVLQLGRPHECEPLIQRAIAINPQSAIYHGNLGRAFLAQGKFGEAETCCRKALSLRPDLADAHHNLGVTYQQTGRPREAIAHLHQAIALRPGFAESYRFLGASLREIGQAPEAVTAFRQAIALDPADAQSHNSLGGALQDLGQTDDAIACYRKAIELSPALAHAHYNLGNLMRDDGSTTRAIESYQRAIALRPVFPECRNNLGLCYQEGGRIDDAIGEYQIAISQQAHFDLAYKNLGNALSQKREFAASREAFEHALRLNPQLDEARFDMGISLLLEGKLSEGWEQYEYRLRVSRLRGQEEFVEPVWDGSDLSGARILIHCEQGLGDAIQFVRYVPLVKRTGGAVTVRCHPELRRLFDGQVEIDAVTSDTPRHGFDVRCPLLSLPHVFHTTLETIPAEVPYLRADPEPAVRWRERLSEFKGFKVGLVWAGNPSHGNDRNRSLSLSMFAPLTTLPGVRLISLQKGPAAEQSRLMPALSDWTSEISDFADTAALIENLDLVISCDTAVAHLSGAMGKPTWVLLPYNPDWRWLLDRTDSPWYPTARLFRQPGPGDWSGVIRQVVAVLGSMAT